MTLMTRTFHGQSQVGRVGMAIICMFAMVSVHEMDVIIVLDEGKGGEEYGRCLLQLAEKFGFTGLRVTTDPMPAMEATESSSMFNGKLEGAPGKDRSQYSNFIADRYTLAPIIGMFDAETCFQVPVLPEYILRNSSSRPQIHNLAEAGGSSWGVDNRVLEVTTVIDVMWPDRMPIFFWRDDLEAAREYISNKWGGPDECFDEAFANITHGGGGLGYTHPFIAKRIKPRWGYSQFNILANYMFYFKPGKYVWHIGTVDMASFEDRLKYNMGLGQMALGRYAYAYFKASVPYSYETYKSSLSREATIAIGRNGVPHQHTLKYSCCRLYPDLQCDLSEVTWERARTLGYNSQEADANPAWLAEPSSAFAAFFTLARVHTLRAPTEVRTVQMHACDVQRKSTSPKNPNHAYDLTTCFTDG